MPRSGGRQKKCLSMDKVADYKHVIEVSAIVAITDQKGILIHVHHNCFKYSPAELIGQDHRIINSVCQN